MNFDIHSSGVVSGLALKTRGFEVVVAQARLRTQCEVSNPAISLERTKDPNASHVLQEGTWESLYVLFT